MKFEIKHCFTNTVLFGCELNAEIAGKNYSLQLGFTIKEAVRSHANLRCADLRCANLRCADLRNADLRYADLCGTDLYSADLYGADLYNADLRNADLRNADLRCADLRNADLRCANLYGADLRNADLRCANLYGANLRCADLRGAENTKLAIARTQILPEGDLIGWKKCRNNVIVKLRIPEAAKRSHAFDRKCRAEFADVLELFGAKEGISKYDANVVYRKGERVVPDSYDTDRHNECSSGVHFFITREEAEAYE